MFRKSNSMITAWERNGNEKFSEIQKSILDEAVKLLKPGGLILYSTCTFSPLENEKSIEYLLSLDDTLKLIEFDKYEKFDDGHYEWSDTKNKDLKYCARLWPHKIDGEGHFVALIKKDDATSDISAIPVSTNTKPTSPVSTSTYHIKKYKLPSEVAQFFDRFNKEFDFKRIDNIGDKLYYIPDNFPDKKGLRLLRCGLYLGEVKKNRFEPSQALAMTLQMKDYKNITNLSLDDARVIKYLKGDTLEVSGTKGYTLVCVDSYPLGWGKINNGTLKNKYLPDWRLMSWK